MGVMRRKLFLFAGRLLADRFHNVDELGNSRHHAAHDLGDKNLMATRDFENYTSLFELMSQFLQAPDLLIYLKADVSTLVSQIAKRGRDYENSINISYLQNLNNRYDAWIEKYKESKQGKLLIIDVNTIKFAEVPEDFGAVIEKIDAEIHGLFDQQVK